MPFTRPNPTTTSSGVFRWFEAPLAWLDSRRNDRFVACAVAVVFTAIAFAATWVLPSLRYQTPFFLFFTTVVLSALYGGIVPGLLATGLSMALVNAFLVAPHPYSLLPAIADLLRLGVFLFSATVVTTLSDRRYRAEQKLRERENRFRQLIENTSDIITILAPDGTILYESPAIERVLGHTPAEMKGKNVFQFIHPDDAAVARATMTDVLGTPQGVAGPMQCRFLCADGSYRFIEAVGKNLLEERSIAGIVVQSRDVTERNQLVRERAARMDAEAAKRRFHELVEGLDVVVWEADPQTQQFTFVSRRAEEMLGYPHDLWMHGQEWTKLVAEEDRGTVVKTLREAAVTGNTDCECRAVTRDGRVLWLRLIVYVDRDQRGAVRQLRGLIVDVTDRRQAEAALRSTERLAATGRLAATIAHEINNPMAAVTNLVYLIENHAGVDETARQFAKLAQEELKRMSHITRQMLGFYRESHDASTMAIPDLLSGVLDLYHRKMMNSSVEVSVELADVPEVYGFAGEIRQVFSNLLLNALDAMGEGGKLAVRVRPARDPKSGASGVRIVFADNGPGIPAEIRHRIFEPFFTTKGQKGTGLGLWVSMGIVSKHGGALKMRSMPGRGTCFSIFLPQAEQVKSAVA